MDRSEARGAGRRDATPGSSAIIEESLYRQDKSRQDTARQMTKLKMSKEKKNTERRGRTKGEMKRRDACWRAVGSMWVKWAAGVEDRLSWGSGLSWEGQMWHEHIGCYRSELYDTLDTLGSTRVLPGSGAVSMEDW